MDRLDVMALFIRVVERSSFTKAAADMGISRSLATTAITNLEQRLNVRLLHRSTRHVRPTLEGEDYYLKCMNIIDLVNFSDESIQGNVSGLIKIDVAGNLARTLILPALSEFLDEYPDVTLQIGESERYVNLISEGVDCVIRAGKLNDSDLIARSLGSLKQQICASPAYLKKFGRPVNLEDLNKHYAVGFISPKTNQPLPFKFIINGEEISIPIRSIISVTSAETSLSAAVNGFGLIQASRYRLSQYVEAGALSEVLPDFNSPEIPISIIYPSSRQLSLRTRNFINWLLINIKPRLS